MVKIRWSETERAALLVEVKRQHIQHPYHTTLELVRRAQQLALSSDRRRDLTRTQQVDWVDAHRQKWIRDGAVKEAPVPQQEVPVRSASQQSVTDVLSDMLSSMLVEIWQDAIAKFKQQVVELEPVVEQRKPHQKRLKRVFIYGLRPDVAAEVVKRMIGCFEFRCLDNSTPARIGAACEWADYTYLMIDFVSHSDQEIMKKHCKNVLLTRGAQSHLLQELEEKYLAQ
jgi:hypothetical protein